MSIRALRIFLAVVAEGSFAGAARGLGITQSAVSLRMRDLETRLGSRLFARSGRNSVLAAEGRELVPRAQEIVQLYDELPARLGTRGDVAGTLRLGAVPTTLSGMLPDALARLQRAQPRLSVRVTAGLSAELALAVERGELDAALTSAPLVRLAAELSWTEIEREKLVVIAPADCRGASDAALLEALPLIRFNRRAWAGQLIDAELRRRSIRITEGMELDSLEAIARMVAHGLGVAIVPRRLADLPEARRLRSVPFGRPPIRRSVVVIERRDSRRAALVRALVEQLLATRRRRRVSARQ